MARWGEIKDPVHGYIELNDCEIAVIDTSQFQRLRRLKQLSGAYLTYPGAEHTRFHHSLGVMHIAGMIAQHFLDMELINSYETQKIRSAALMHDLGHGPFSHLFEEVLNKRELNHEILTSRIIKETQVANELSAYGLDPDEMSTLSVGKSKTSKQFMNQIIAGQFSADVLDYLVRDSYFTGVEYGRVDIHRLMRSMDVLDGSLALKDTALYVLEAMVIARYEMFKAVYFHRSVRAAEVMLVRALELSEEELGLTDFETMEDYLRLDDSSILAELASLKDSQSSKSKTAYDLAEGFTNRKLLKCAYETVVHRRDRFNVNMMLMSGIRNNLETDLADDADVDKDYVIIDVSTAPSVPYYALQKSPQDIPLFHKNPDGEKIPINFSQVSPLGDTLIGYLDIMRVYTKKENLDAVRKAAETLFGQENATMRL